MSGGASKRCRHPDVRILEELRAYSIWDFRDGLLAGDSCREDLIGMVEAQCDDCGYRRRFGTRAKRPAWLAARLQQIKERQTE